MIAQALAVLCCTAWSVMVTGILYFVINCVCPFRSAILTVLIPLEISQKYLLKYLKNINSICSSRMAEHEEIVGGDYIYHNILRSGQLCLLI